jgi:hypothetical protein
MRGHTERHMLTRNDNKPLHALGRSACAKLRKG